MSELFTNFEVNWQSRRQIVLQLIVGSVVLHLIVAAAVLYVPTLRETFNIALLAGNASYVDRAYRKTIVGEDIQMVSVSPRFRYPDGYFSTGYVAPLVVPTPDPLAPRIVSTYTPPRVISTPLPLPTPIPSPSASATPALAGPTNSPATTAVTTPAAIKTGAEAETKKAVDDEVLGVKEGDKENEFNTRPLKDWLGGANALKEKGVLDLTADVEMTIEARLNAQCKLEDPKVVQKSGDQMMVDVAKNLAAAIGDSRMLLFLRDPAKVQQNKDAKSLPCDPMALRFAIRLDQLEFNATVQTEADSADRASQLAKGYNFALGLGEFNARKNGKSDEASIMKSTRVTSEGKQIVVHFQMPRASATELLKKQIEPKPSG